MQLRVAVCATVIFLIYVQSASGNIDTVYGHIGVSATYYFGKHIKHNQRITPELKGITHAYEISVFKQTDGRKAWMRKLRHPEIGGALHITQNVNIDTFGWAIGAMGTVQFWLWRTRPFDLFVRLGSGVAFFTHYYDKEKNPNNNVIGSSPNVIAQFKIGGNIKPLPWLHIALFSAFTHHSNGALRPPNLGINVVSGGLSVRYFPAHHAIALKKGNIPKEARPNEIMARYGLGWVQAWYEGPMMPVHFVTLAYARYTSIVNKVLGGLAFEYSTAKQYFWAGYPTATDKMRRTYPMNLSFFAGDELMVNRVSMLWAIGVYVYRPEPTRDKVYFRGGANYYPYDLGKQKNIRPFVGAHLKTHQAVAETIEFVAGICIR
ncbi:MAG: acyloxyacyl hydrolase [Chitinophagales bacterium]|nr:acyloxyacyl hydrolase [Chitinophagales bacterium]MDW8272599.1 acyloxyacyl hydrolase [Chitinophagales bacterium]